MSEWKPIGSRIPSHFDAGRIAGLREAAEIVADLDTKYIGAQGCFKEAQRTILARITELEKP